MTHRPRSLMILATLLLAVSQAAQAVIVTFDHRGDFLAATGATGNGSFPAMGNIGPTSLTFGDITFTGNLNFQDWTSRLPGAELAINGVENLDVDITLAYSAFALGFDFVEPESDPNVNAPFFDTTFGVTLLNGASTVDVFTFNAPNDVAAFVGVWSDAAFDRVEIRDLTNTIDNEFFGEFYIGTAAPVPEPATVMLVALGLLGLGALRKRLN